MYVRELIVLQTFVVLNKVAYTYTTPTFILNSEPLFNAYLGLGIGRIKLSLYIRVIMREWTGQIIRLSISKKYIYLFTN